MGVSAVVAVAGAYSASQASDAAKGAAETQKNAGQAAIAAQQQAAQQQQALQEPFRTAGVSALNQLIAGTQPGGQFTKQFQMAVPTATPYKAEESQAQQFATKEALAAMQNQMAVGGQGLSSNAITGAGKLAGNIASQYEQQGYNQWLQSNQQALAAQAQGYNQFMNTQQAQMAPLEYMANMGQAAASGQASNLGQTASNITNLQTGIGNAQAAGQIGSANAISAGVNNIGQYAMLQSVLGGNNPAGTTLPGQLSNPGQAPASYDWGTMGQGFNAAPMAASPILQTA